MDNREMFPLVSVIIPGYNYSQYLKQRIDSVLAQSYPNIEVILLDDCSTDDSADIMLSYKDNPKVSCVIVNEKTSGSPFIQWEKGISHSKGEYIWIAEADDYADCNFLSKLVIELDHHPDAVVAYAFSYMVDESGKLLDSDWDKMSADGKVDIYSSTDFLQRKLFWGCSIYNASSAVFRKEAYGRISKDFVNMRYCGDYLFFFFFSKEGGVIMVHDKLNYFRQHNNRVTVKSFNDIKRLQEILFIYKVREQYCLPNTWHKWFARGVIYKDIKRLPVDRHMKEEMYNMAQSSGIFKKHYLFERAMKFVSCIIPQANPSNNI